MKFIIAQHPGQTSPLLMAQKAATFDQLSNGRLIINIVNGGDNVGPPHGVFLSHRHPRLFASPPGTSTRI